MCRISDEIYNEGYQVGYSYGYQIGYSYGYQIGYSYGYQIGIEPGDRDRIGRGAKHGLLNNVRNLMETVGWTAQEALEKLKVPAAEQKRYLSML